MVCIHLRDIDEKKYDELLDVVVILKNEQNTSQKKKNMELFKKKNQR